MPLSTKKTLTAISLILPKVGPCGILSLLKQSIVVLLSGKTEGGANFDPTPLLCEMAELLEKEHDTYIAKDPDPFEDRHPSR